MAILMYLNFWKAIIMKHNLPYTRNQHSYVQRIRELIDVLKFESDHVMLSDYTLRMLNCLEVANKHKLGREQ